MKTFSPYTTSYFGRFHVTERHDGQFRVHRFNRFQNVGEIWDHYDSRGAADRACGLVNKVLSEREENEALRTKSVTA